MIVVWTLDKQGKDPDTVLDGSRIFIIEVSTHWLRSLAWSHEGYYLAAGGRFGVVHVWNPFTGEQAQKWQLKGSDHVF
ncbi:hypothetical protein V1509DRAFT_635743 [Lipomyces kononenkoae]